MVKDVLGWLDYSICAEVALGLFIAAFIGIGIYTFFRSDDELNQQAAIPLSDEPITPRGGHKS
ncbi:hypothetical protein [Calycomorphotria hydatis]|uniref:Cbb3-type cytochrome oxidase component FixQ n=1 Tax=Calycomorphotria hydatis TaxID=2528027 RepID=A0A517T3Q9_9PLAN|nr:hypothetical protein [Calycomorphotria hydatis]QDT62999.1 hypothetical protein V22_01970 [Calycomorphotria hydatis]